MTIWIILTFIFSIFVCGCYGGECCKAYYDLSFNYNDETWCDDYCCGTSVLGVLECCDNLFLQAPADDRKGFCTDYFAKNVWAPILIALGGLGIIITCIACCYCCCHSHKTPGRVIVPAQQPYHTNVMLLNPTATQQPGYNPSYGAYPVQPATSGIQPVPGDQETETKHPLEA